MEEKNHPVNYKLNSYYFTKAWGNKTNVKMPNVKSKAAVDIKKLAQAGITGNILAIKNNKVILNESTGYANVSKKEHNTPKTAFLLIQLIRFLLVPSL